MVNDVQSPPESSVTGLVTGIVKDAQELLKQQMALARSEIQDDFRKSKEALFSLGLGIAAAAVAAIFVCQTAVYLLHWATEPNLPLWACFAIVAGTLAVASTILFVAGKKKLDSFNPLPDQSLQGLKENLQWKTNLR